MAAGAWLVIGLTAIFAGTWWLGQAGIFVALAVAFAGFVIVMEAVVAVWGLRARGLPALLLVGPMLLAIVATLVLLNPVLRQAHVMPSRQLLARERASFDAVASGAAITMPGVLAVERRDGAVRFLTQNGMLGASRAVVFDPSDRLAGANGWAGGRISPAAAKLFYDVRWCYRLDVHWYHCHFG
ncbi:hypothetical protein SAMN06297144_1585 [Sphingomonas guangdongensis]|uniref:Uncharacterized protein n=1 Tax=Sphingomonas guangdongensis TaxID=1141890 RepID=A0A285QWY8_9SPHN|nr:hypothetical protein [Sphingomonas guangdongensis]SOB86480.1 hypothetical protein SAMN06297144_1585 [Sphingomonas guangdongensis]